MPCGADLIQRVRAAANPLAPASERQVPPRLGAHLRAAAARYFPELAGDVRVELVQRREVSTSSIYVFSLAGRRAHRRVVAKVRRGWAEYNEEPWARLVPAPPARERQAREFAALEGIHAHFAQRSDEGFDAIRPLELLPEEETLVMEIAVGRDLSEMLGLSGRSPRGAQATDRTREAVEAAGRWLRVYHRMPPSEGTPRHVVDRDALLSSIEENVSFVAARAHVDGPALVGAARCAAAELDDPLPTGVAHADFWPGNVMVAPDGRITVIDTRAPFVGARFADVAYFLTALKAPSHQVLTQGWTQNEHWIGDLERVFLAAYFAGSVPLAAVRLFEVQLLLHNWQRSERVSKVAAGWRGASKRLRLGLRRRFYAGRVSVLLGEACRPGFRSAE